MRRINRFLPPAKLILLLFFLLDAIQLFYFIRAARDGRILIEINIYRKEP